VRDEVLERRHCSVMPDFLLRMSADHRLKEKVTHVPLTRSLRYVRVALRLALGLLDVQLRWRRARSESRAGAPTSSSSFRSTC
jgi:hypothetical protein